MKSRMAATVKDVGELPFAGLEDELVDAVSKVLWNFFQSKTAPTRSLVLQQLGKEHPEQQTRLGARDLSFQVAQILYVLVRRQLLVRKVDKYYPGPELVSRLQQQLNSSAPTVSRLKGWSNL